MNVSSGGSSPLVRGTVLSDEDSGTLRRFIPARAGNSAQTGSRSMCCAVHPRSCGEQICVWMFALAASGSSPLVRGTADISSGAVGGLRFIPARAGNSPYVTKLPPLTAVHPRSCGEQSRCNQPLSLPTGSSPLVRGTGKSCRYLSSAYRFIPARAGNSLTIASKWSTSTVHPRSCGEQQVRTLTEWCFCGSSPLVRGTVNKITCGDNCDRFIPARAGNSSRWREYSA